MSNTSWSPGLNGNDMYRLPESMEATGRTFDRSFMAYKSMDPWSARASRMSHAPPMADASRTFEDQEPMTMMDSDANRFPSTDTRRSPSDYMHGTPQVTAMPVEPMPSPPAMTYPSFAEKDVTSTVAEIPSTGISKVHISAPLGCWQDITDPIVKGAEIQREINNRNNFFILPGSMKFTLDKTPSTEWTVKSEWGEDFENKPNEFQGSKFAGDRLIKAIYLREAHNMGDVTHTLIFSLPNKSMEFNMLAPIRKVLSPAHMEGPVHLSLEPGEKMSSPIPLWAKNYDIDRSRVIQDHPDTTRDDLQASLKVCHADPKNKAVLLPDDVLCEYIREQTEGTDYEGDLDWIPGAHHYEISKEIANEHIENWVSEQCLDLTVNKIWDISVRPGAVEAGEELKRTVPVHYLGDDVGVNDFLRKVASGMPQHISFKIQVELEPYRRG